MKVYLNNGKVKAEAESLEDIEILLSFKKGVKKTEPQHFLEKVKPVKRYKAKRGLKKWTREEDEQLIELINKNIPYRKIGIAINNRSKRSVACRFSHLKKNNLVYMEFDDDYSLVPYTVNRSGEIKVTNY